MPQKPTAVISFVDRFNFNRDKLLEETLRIPVAFTQIGPGQTELQIPAFIPTEAIKAPAHTLQIEFCISAVALRLNNDNIFGNENLTITLPYNESMQAARNILLLLQTEAGNILIVALQIRYATRIGLQFKYLAPAKCPAAIVAAVYL